VGAVVGLKMLSLGWVRVFAGLAPMCIVWNRVIG
jgi:hypothetical protein